MSTTSEEHGLLAKHSDHIRLADTNGETTITWLVPSTVQGRISQISSRLVCSLLCLFVGMSPTIARLGSPHSAHGFEFLRLSALLYLPIFVYMAAWFVATRRPAIAARLTLNRDHLAYFPGRHQDGPGQMPRFRMLRKPQKSVLPRGQVGFLSVEGIPLCVPNSNSHCLTVFHHAKPVLRMGGSLSEKDLLWLQGIIEEWKAQVNPVRAMEQPLEDWELR